MINVKMLLLSACSGDTSKVRCRATEEQLQPIGAPSPPFAGDSFGDQLTQSLDLLRSLAL